MWVFTNKGFVSIVEHRDDISMMVVRSRFAGHIRNLFPRAKVIRTPDADYLFRAFVPRIKVAEVMFKSAKNINYPNFKNSIADDRYHAACADVWSALYRHQR